MAVELRQLGPRGGHKPARHHLWGGGGVRACDSLVAHLTFFQIFGGLFWSKINHHKVLFHLDSDVCCVSLAMVPEILLLLQQKTFQRRQKYVLTGDVLILLNNGTRNPSATAMP